LPTDIECSGSYRPKQAIPAAESLSVARRIADVAMSRNVAVRVRVWYSRVD
jgi:hypothetical protein